MWVYRTSVGTFSIRPCNGGFNLWINDENLGHYTSAIAAADDVYMCATGHWPWDQRMIVDQPTDLSEWSLLP